MSDQSRICVSCVDDHPLLRDGIAAIINSQPDMLLAAEASNGGEAIQKFREHQPDVTLMDLRLQNLVERGVILCDGETFSIDETCLIHESPRGSRSQGATATRLLRLDEFQQRELIEEALAESRGNLA
jgi:DNA-binding NarL/FixJ family response regulator